MTVTDQGRLEQHLRAEKERGRKLLVPYITGGFGKDWLDVARAVVGSGADAIEIGIPFSDPVMDGPVIQAASVKALEAGATPFSILSELARIEVSVPVVVMTYLNVVVRTGYKRMALRMIEAGVSGAIIPDLPYDEGEEWRDEAGEAGLDVVQLVAPTTPGERLDAICSCTHGFVYAVGTLGVTGERTEIGRSALELAARCKAVSDLPVLVGVGISTPRHVREVAAVADGAIVGSGLVRRLLDGEGVIGAAAFVSELRRALDDGEGAADASSVI